MLKTPKRDKGTQNIINLISSIQKLDKHGDIKTLFTKGLCFDFAIMLWRSAPGSRIFYITNKRHVVVLYNGTYYDVNGEYPITSNDTLIESDYVMQSYDFTEKSRSNF